MRIPKAVIPKFSGVKTDLLTDADNSDLRKAIRDAVPAAVEQTKDLAQYFKATNERETCKRIFDYLKKNVKYKADDWQQVVQMPSAIMRKGAIADCKSMSLFTAAILQNLGIPWHFVLASYTDSAIPGHIYCVTDSGCIIDVVWGKFDSEKKANHRYKMKVSYLAGITGPMIAGTGKSGGYCGIGATEGAVEWAKRNRVWDNYNAFQKVKIAAAKVFPIGIAARGIILTAIAGNAGGFATALKTLSNGAAAGNQDQWNKFRSIELNWLENGGNPNELYDAMNKGQSKSPKGKKFAELMAKKAKGENLRPDQWIAALVSALFGKRYNASTGGISGEPATTTATAAASSSIWIPILQNMAVAIGAAITTAIIAKVAPSADETTGGGGETPGGGGTPGGTQGGTPGGAETPKSKTTLYIVGGVAALAALWYFTKKKK
jgi:hypothetical protein